MKFFAAFAALVAVAAAAPTTSWSLNELSEAIQNPATPTDVLPYLEHALNQMMGAIFAGQAVDSIVVPTPAGLLPVDFAPVAPVEVAPVPASVAPAPAVIADASGSPLVQIIVNIRSQESVVPGAVAEAPAPAPAPVPEPVLVVEQPSPVVPEPIVIVPEVPSPIVVAPLPIEVPSPNPIDVIAVGAPEVNPIDLLQPTPIVVPGEIAVGPIV